MKALNTWRARWRPLAAALLAAGMLAGCGGGGGDPGAPLSCSASDRKLWLADYMDDWYFWTALSPKPSASAYPTPDRYFEALLYTGVDSRFPKADVWSFGQSTESFNQFWGSGRTLGYGLMVNGLEAPSGGPLYVRYVEPGSPAARAGLLRGDQIVSVNGVPASSLIASGDFSVLSPSASGEQLSLVVRTTDGDWSLALSAATYALAPVPDSAVFVTGSGRKVGYVLVKDMVSQALDPVDAAFASFRTAGVQDLVLDLRYNGGGLVSVAADIAAYPSGARTAGQVFSTLLHNAAHQSANESYLFPSRANATQLSRVFVLTGPRTCSASEQLINALTPFVQVIAVGDTSCGKPVGFRPQDDGCGTTWSAVNFESVNALNEGRYFDGFDATCPVAEDWTQPLGSSSEPLLGAALSYADTGVCPVSASGLRASPLGRQAAAAQRSRVKEPGERGGMILR